jgi:hypothetical protein
VVAREDERLDVAVLPREDLHEAGAREPLDARSAASRASEDVAEPVFGLGGTVGVGVGDPRTEDLEKPRLFVAASNHGRTRLHIPLSD